MDQNRSNKPGGDRPGSTGWSPSSQPGKAAGPGSISGTTDSPARSEAGFAPASPGRSAEHKGFDNAGEDGRGLQKTGEEIRRGARDLREQALNQGREALGRVQHRVEESVDEGKAQIADQIDSIGEALCDAAERIEQEQGTVGRYARMAGEQVCTLADYLRDAEPADMARGVQRFARQRPELFLGGALVTGLLLGRFLRSHEPEPDYDRGPYGRDDIEREQFRRDNFESSTGIGNAAMGGTSYGTKPSVESGVGIGSRGSTGFSAGSSGGTGGVGSSGIGGSSSLGSGGTGSAAGTGGGGGFGSPGQGGSKGNINKNPGSTPQRDDTSPGGPGCAI